MAFFRKFFFPTEDREQLDAVEAPRMASDSEQLRRTLEGREQQLGAQHEDTLIAVVNLAVLLHAQGKLAEAEPLCRRALERCARQIGEDHAVSLAAVHNLAALLLAQGKLAEAEPLCRRALEGREQILGAQHPDALLSARALATLLTAQGRLAEAEPLFGRCASSREMAAARCLGCGTQAELKKCDRCHVARFCGAECVARAWPAHQPNCRLWRVAS